MTEYEITCLFKTKGATVEETLEVVKKAITDLKGTVGKVTDMGNRELAYPVQKEIRGHYYTALFNFDRQGIPKLQENLRLIPNLMKFIIVNPNE